MNLSHVFSQADAVGKAVAILLLAMSIASWVIILYKLWLLTRADRTITRSVAAYWQAPSAADAGTRVAEVDRMALATPLVVATQLAPAGTMAGAGGREQQLTRRLRNALHGAVARLQFGQTLLATVGSIAPFVGLLGTVWGIFHALTGIAAAGQVSIEKVAGPVGEALIMTAAGLAVAIPAVLAYNWFGRTVARLEGELEGFARDLRELFTQAD
ncbi:flagellar motor protein MotA [Comamonas serinivorans]|uniref:Biopolymer transport protein ExbB n=1 Tax=Comamonas serinivorans TaxID=1082851 RepID=A0A1Y0EJT9_9BURK|nr:MotA/TolQ/ExbB proton channel family protein [Comamonas serinivorans]ARU03629.1 flagellar motor protein MotA [Comamonas serinivorans]